MKKHRTVIIIVALCCIVAATFVYFLLKEPKPIDSHTDDYDRVVAENKAFQENEATTLQYIESLVQSAKRKDSAITALKAEQAATRKALDKTTIQATRLAKEVKELSRADTSVLGRKCDSLAEQAENFAYLYEQYKDYSDNIAVQMDSMKGDYATALAEQRQLYNELKVKYDALFSAYTTLFSDYSKALKTIKRERLKTKIAALLGLIAGAGAVLK